MSAMSWIRGFNATVGRLAPDLAASKMHRAFLTPRELPPRDWELPLLAEAERVTLRFGLSALRWGQGPAVLLLHGWEGRPTQFAELIRALVRAGYGVVALDAPAHGRSPGHEANVVLFARALLEASAGKVLHIMFPMVSEPWEYEQARALVEKQRRWLQSQKKKLPIAVRYGAMLEVPALAEVLDLLLPRLDFLSIGTNDLTQFLFAADRAHPRLAERYDWLSIAILRFIDRVVRACQAQDVPVGVCGEMGGRTLEAMALIGLGIRRLSITPASVGPVKAMIRAVDAAELEAMLRDMLDSGVTDIRARLTRWAAERSIELG